MPHARLAQWTSMRNGTSMSTFTAALAMSPITQVARNDTVDDDSITPNSKNTITGMGMILATSANSMISVVMSTGDYIRIRTSNTSIDADLAAFPIVAFSGNDTVDGGVNSTANTSDNDSNLNLTNQVATTITTDTTTADAFAQSTWATATATLGRLPIDADAGNGTVDDAANATADTNTHEDDGNDNLTNQVATTITTGTTTADAFAQSTWATATATLGRLPIDADAGNGTVDDAANATADTNTRDDDGNDNLTSHVATTITTGTTTTMNANVGITTILTFTASSTRNPTTEQHVPNSTTAVTTVARCAFVGCCQNATAVAACPAGRAHTHDLDPCFEEVDPAALAAAHAEYGCTDLNAATQALRVLRARCCPCAISPRFADTDLAAGRVRGHVRFGPTTFEGVVQESLICGYRVFLVDSSGAKLGRPVAYVAAHDLDYAPGEASCCAEDFYSARVETALPAGFDRFMVVAVTRMSGEELPIGATTERIVDLGSLHAGRLITVAGTLQLSVLDAEVFVRNASIALALRICIAEATGVPPDLVAVFLRIVSTGTRRLRRRRLGWSAPPARLLGAAGLVAVDFTFTVQVPEGGDVDTFCEVMDQRPAHTLARLTRELGVAVGWGNGGFQILNATCEAKVSTDMSGPGTPPAAPAAPGSSGGDDADAMSSVGRVVIGCLGSALALACCVAAALFGRRLLLSRSCDGGTVAGGHPLKEGPRRRNGHNSNQSPPGSVADRSVEVQTDLPSTPHKEKATEEDSQLDCVKQSLSGCARETNSVPSPYGSIVSIDFCAEEGLATITPHSSAQGPEEDDSWAPSLCDEDNVSSSGSSSPMDLMTSVREEGGKVEAARKAPLSSPLVESTLTKKEVPKAAAPPPPPPRSPSPDEAPRPPPRACAAGAEAQDGSEGSRSLPSAPAETGPVLQQTSPDPPPGGEEDAEVDRAAGSGAGGGSASNGDEGRQPKPIVSRLALSSPPPLPAVPTLPPEQTAATGEEGGSPSGPQPPKSEPPTRLMSKSQPVSRRLDGSTVFGSAGDSPLASALPKAPATPPEQEAAAGKEGGSPGAPQPPRSKPATRRGSRSQPASHGSDRSTVSGSVGGSLLASPLPAASTQPPEQEAAAGRREAAPARSNRQKASQRRGGGAGRSRHRMDHRLTVSGSVGGSLPASPLPAAGAQPSEQEAAVGKKGGSPGAPQPPKRSDLSTVSGSAGVSSPTRPRMKSRRSPSDKSPTVSGISPESVSSSVDGANDQRSHAAVTTLSDLASPSHDTRTN